jgi:DNA-binding transcriptional ArsR family regulator
MILHESGRLNASEIVKKTKLSQPTVSHHLKVLREAEIVVSEKKGKEVYYSLSAKHIASCCGDFAGFFSKNARKGS